MNRPFQVKRTKPFWVFESHPFGFTKQSTAKRQIWIHLNLRNNITHQQHKRRTIQNRTHEQSNLQAMPNKCRRQNQQWRWTPPAAQTKRNSEPIWTKTESHSFTASADRNRSKKLLNNKLDPAPKNQNHKPPNRKKQPSRLKNDCET
jgi:hypothetical protein